MTVDNILIIFDFVVRAWTVATWIMALYEGILINS